jgi:hypothetical protein
MRVHRVHLDLSDTELLQLESLCDRMGWTKAKAMRVAVNIADKVTEVDTSMGLWTKSSSGIWTKPQEVFINKFMHKIVV